MRQAPPKDYQISTTKKWGCVGVGVWGRGAGAVVAHDYWGSSYKILGLFLQNTGVLLTKYWGSSYKILGFFLQHTGVLLTKYWASSYKILGFYLQNTGVLLTK